MWYWISDNGGSLLLTLAFSNTIYSLKFAVLSRAVLLIPQSLFVASQPRNKSASFAQNWNSPFWSLFSSFTWVMLCSFIQQRLKCWRVVFHEGKQSPSYMDLFSWMFTYIPCYTQTLLFYLKTLRGLPITLKVVGVMHIAMQMKTFKQLILDSCVPWLVT